MKKETGKILSQLFLIIALIAMMGFMINHFFFQNRELLEMGYTRQDIQKFKEYEILDRIEYYNPFLVKAINNDRFRKENLDYYIAIKTDSDLTLDVNDLAEKYSVIELVDLHDFLSEEEFLKLVFTDKIGDNEIFRQTYSHGYALAKAVWLSNSLPKTSLQHFLELDKLENPEIYLDLLRKGYNDATITLAAKSLTPEEFEHFAAMRHVPEIFDLISAGSFRMDLMPRYLWYMQNRKVNAKNAVKAVNADKDVVNGDDLDYTAFYNGATGIPRSYLNEETVLVNKQNYLGDFIPDNLISLEIEYRGNNQPLVREAAEAFMKMADALKQDKNLTLIAQNSYISFEDQQNIYDLEIEQREGDDSTIDETVMKAGYSDHQSGLAVDVVQKGTSMYEFGQTGSFSWLGENAWKYGFIRRYPENREFITGLRPVTYHYRYVGKQAAELIHYHSWTLEEYCFLYQQ